MKQWPPAFAVTVVSVVLAGAQAGEPTQPGAGAQPEPPGVGEASSGDAEPVVGTPIESGFFIFDGRYVPPPYVVRQRGDDVFVNDHLLPAERDARPRFRFGPAGPGGWGGFGGGGRASRFTRTEQQFRDGVLLFVLEDGVNGFIVPQNAITVLDILLSDASTESKIQSLSDGRFPRFNATEWAAVVESFEATPNLAQRVHRIKAEDARLVEEAHRARRRVEILDSAPVKYGVTVVAMVLVVVALGTLLNHRPKSDVRWTDVDRDGDGVGMVMWNVALLALLNVFDLALSLVAQQAGGFLELNPLGDKLASSPASLAAFKITALLTSCLILTTLRKYRGVQTASWWLCLICTILTFRWLTYNSMFLT